jgi:hypothetical protein
VQWVLDLDLQTNRLFSSALHGEWIASPLRAIPSIGHGLASSRKTILRSAAAA